MAEIKIELTAAELIFIMQECEGTVLPGVTDTYQGLDEAEKSRMLLDVEDSLRERELRKRAFGGKISYNQKLLEMIKVLVNFEHYIGIDYRKANEKLVTERFYECGGKWVALSGYSNSFFLYSIATDEIKASLDRLPEDSGNRSNHISLLIPKREFKLISSLVESGNVNEAKNRIVSLDADEYNKQFLVDGLSFMTDFATITAVFRVDEGVSVRSVSALIRDDAMAEFYQTVAEDNRTMIGLRAASIGTWVELKGVAEKWLIA